jgi:hypothetical protein
MLIYAPHSYKCKCGKVQTHNVWSNEFSTTTFKCENPKCKREVGPEQVIKFEKLAVHGIRTPTKNRV